MSGDMRSRPLSRRTFLAAAAGFGGILRGAGDGAFRPLEVNHVALRVKDLKESEEFYRNTFRAPGIIFEKPGQRYMRMGQNFVALFQRGEPAMDHFAISIHDYDADAVEAKTRKMGLETRRSSSFVYVHDPDGIEVQIAHAEHEVHSPVVRKKPTSGIFQGNGINHLALSVTDLERSQRFYQRLFGLPLVRQSSQNRFLGVGDNFLALFKGKEPGMHHFCVSVEGYEAGDALSRLEEAQLESRRADNRVYARDPNGLEFQVASADHRP